MPVFVDISPLKIPQLNDQFLREEIWHLDYLTNQHKTGTLPLEVKRRISDFALHVTESFRGSDVGREIGLEIATGMMDNFSVPHTFHSNVTQTNLTKFFTKIATMTNVSPGFVKGIRFYIGKSSADSFFNIIAIPVCGPDKDESDDPLAHKDDLEKSFFEANAKAFFALNIATGKIIEGDSEIANTARLIYIKDRVFVPDAMNPQKAATQVVYFSLANLEKFISKLKSNNINFSMARIAPSDCLSFVLEGKDAVLVYFNKGDLIPPPDAPINDSFF